MDTDNTQDGAEPSPASAGSASHTPAPWRIATISESFAIATAPNDDGKYLCLAVLPGCQNAENLANAKLLATAPDLLSMLKRIILATDEGYDDAVWKLIELARETVSMAENG
ncbi:MAG: hypothetical protein EBR82_85150 [Caulobacteraceae bacterium]|nr:hypothetical protein [Caulobacteraceae bacterium]